MSKKIVVDSCEICPLCNYEQFIGDGWKHVCTHPGMEGQILDDTSIIHPNCPLEENTPSCTCHD